MPFSFLNAALLAGLAAGALPILIHLFSRRKVAKIPFSSIKFLEEISRRRVRRVKMTQWIILALRTLAVALFALALSRPAFQGDFALGKSRGESAVAIVLDRSFSMAAEGERSTLWERARSRANEVLDALQSEDQVLFLGVDPGESELEAYPDPGSAREALRAMEVGFGATDFAAAVRRAGVALGQTTALNKELFIISDFQANALGEGIDLETTDLTPELDPETRVFLLPVDEGPLPNVSLVEARIEGSAVDQRVRVLLARHGEGEGGDIAVTVEAGSEVLGEAILPVPASTLESGEISLTRLPGEGENLVARLSRDRLPVDDVRYIAPLGAGRLPTLVVQEPAQPSPFLPLALSPVEDAGRFEVRRLSPEALASVDLARYRLLVLDNVTFLPRDLLQRLRQWRAAGGLLLLTLGDRVDLRYYNEDLLPALMPGVSLGNLLGTGEATGSAYSLTPRAPGHAAFTGFEARVGQPVTGAAFWRIVEVQSGSEVRTLAEFGPGLPAMVESEGAILFASSLDGRWNNFPTHAAFVPLIHQSLEAMLRERGGENVIVGEPVEAIIERALIPAGAELIGRGPGNLVLQVTPETAPRGVALRTTATPVPGFYELEVGDRVVARRAVNVDPAESNLLPMTHEDLRQLFPGDRTLLLDFATQVGSPIREARYGREFWKELVALVLVLLLVEAWLSRRGVA